MRRTGLLLAVVIVLAAIGPAIGANHGRAQRVTFHTDRTVLNTGETVRLFGSVDNGMRGELVEIEVKDCGQRSFRGVTAATTGEGGEWSADFYPGISTTIRAVWKRAASIQIPIHQRARVSIHRKRSTGQLELWVVGKTHFWQKRALLQRRAGGSWKTVRQVLLTEQIAAGAGTIWSGSVATGATFRSPVAKGTLVRAVFPLSQARPCYLASVSNAMRA